VRVVCSDAPKITCDDVEATLGQRDVQLRCFVDSRPSPASLFWLTEPNVTLTAATAARSDPPPAAAAAGQYSTLVRVRFLPHPLLVAASHSESGPINTPQRSSSSSFSSSCDYGMHFMRFCV